MMRKIRKICLIPLLILQLVSMQFVDVIRAEYIDTDKFQLQLFKNLNIPENPEKAGGYRVEMMPETALSEVDRLMETADDEGKITSTVITDILKTYTGEETLLVTVEVFEKKEDTSKIAEDVKETPIAEFEMTLNKASLKTLYTYDIAADKVNVDQKPTINEVKISDGKDVDVMRELTIDVDAPAIAVLTYELNDQEGNPVAHTTGYDDNIFVVDKNDTYTAIIKDQFGNNDNVSIVVRTICKGPRIEINEHPWNKDSNIFSVSLDTTECSHMPTDLDAPYVSIDKINWMPIDHQFEIDKNQDIDVFVKDTYDNVYQQTFTLNKIDEEGPSFDLELSDEENWSTKKTLNVINILDAGVGIADNPIKVEELDDKGLPKEAAAWLPADSEITLDHNGMYRITVKDKLDNSNYKRLEVKTIDTINPEFKINVSDASVWKTTKNLNVVAKDVDSGIAKILIEYKTSSSYETVVDHVVSDADNKKVDLDTPIFKNGSYRITTVDNAGNKIENDVIISKIDTFKPIINVSFDDETWGQHKTITIQASDPDSDPNSSSGLKETPYKLEMQKEDGTWETVGSYSTNTITIIKNAKYHIVVADKAGNEETSAEFAFDKLDDVAPEAGFTLDDSSWTQSKTLKIVDAKDMPEGDNSGLPEKPFKVEQYNQATDSWDLYCDWTSNSSIPILHNGLFRYIVRDNVGNELNTSTRFYVTHVDVVKPALDGTIRIEQKNTSLAAKLLHYASFGTYFNDAVTISIPVKDLGAKNERNISGVSQVTLYSDFVTMPDETEYTFATKPEKGVATFTIPLKTYRKLEGKLSYNITDTAGNETGIIPISSKNANIQATGSNTIMIETRTPDINIMMQQGDALSYQEPDKLWVNKDVTFTYDIQDKDSGLYAWNILGNQVVLRDSTKDDLASAKVERRQGEINTAAIQADSSTGKYDIAVSAQDNAGNTASEKRVVYKDVQAPYIQEFHFQNQIGYPGDVAIMDYGFFFQEDVQVEIIANDIDFDGSTYASSGLKSIFWYTIDSDGVKSEVHEAQPDEQQKITFTISKGFKGQLYAGVSDHVGNMQKDDFNQMKFVSPEASIIEDNQDHELEGSHIQYTLQEHTATDNQGFPLYSAVDGAPVQVVIQDKRSGIQQVEWFIKQNPDQDDTTFAHSFSLDLTKDYQINDVITVDGIQWVVKAMDRNLVTRLEAEVRIHENLNHMTLCSAMRDWAGNRSIEDTTLSIDQSAPILDMTFDNTTDDETFDQFYAADRSAYLTLQERNFDNNMVHARITRDGNDMGNAIDWTLTNGNDASLHSDDTTYTAAIPFTADGDYAIELSITDKTGNTSIVQTAAFTIDKTKPTYQVAFDNNNAANESYYAQGRVATITIQEHNFDASRFQLLGTATDNGATIAFPSVNGWSNDGDTHTAQVAFQSDGQYELDFDYRDKAGNGMDDYAPQVFTIDLTTPTLEIVGIEDSSSHNGVVQPVVEYSDTNYSASDLRVTLTGAKRGNLVPDGQRAEGATGGTYTLQDFPKNADNDDIYTIQATMEDKAGNQIVKEKRFSVNRFGSAYILGETLDQTNIKYVKEAFDVVIDEENVDSLNDVVVKMTKDNDTVNLTQGTDYQVSNINSVWNQYRYTISKSLFQNDGVYSITLRSQDRAGNINDSTSPVKQATVTFGIDKTSPIIIPWNMESDTIYNEVMHEATFTVKDNLKLSDVSIQVNGRSIEYEQNGDEYRIQIPEQLSAQSIVVRATDAAGNEYTQELRDVYVTTNTLVRFYANKPFMYGVIAGSCLVVAAIATLIYKRKKRKQLTA